MSWDAVLKKYDLHKVDTDCFVESVESGWGLMDIEYGRDGKQQVSHARQPRFYPAWGSLVLREQVTQSYLFLKRLLRTMWKIDFRSSRGNKEYLYVCCNVIGEKWWRSDRWAGLVGKKHNGDHGERTWVIYLMICLMEIKGRQKDWWEYQGFCLDGWCHGEGHSSVWDTLTLKWSVERSNRHFLMLIWSSGKHHFWK